MNCTHHECRCARANELALIADRTGDARYSVQAIEAHSQEVICRRVQQVNVEIRRTLRAKYSDDQIFAWLGSCSVQLDGRIPAQLIAAGAGDQVLDAARRLVTQ